jgi:hypothetical protein
MSVAGNDRRGAGVFRQRLVAVAITLVAVFAASAEGHSSFPTGAYQQMMLCRSGHCRPYGSGVIEIKAGRRYEVSSPTINGSGSYRHYDRGVIFKSGPLAHLRNKYRWYHGWTHSGKAKLVQCAQSGCANKSIYLRAPS